VDLAHELLACSRQKAEASDQKDLMHYSSLPSRVLAIDATRQTCKLVECIPDYDYCALSWVWGNSTQGWTHTNATQSILQRGVPISQLPTVLQDALSVTAELGLSYLWVDAVCINHSDLDEHYDQITRMADIYYNAKCTIAVSLSGEPRTKEFSKGKKLRFEPYSLFCHDNSYRERAWVIQESFLARKISVSVEDSGLWLIACDPCDLSERNAEHATYAASGLDTTSDQQEDLASTGAVLERASSTSTQSSDPASNTLDFCSSHTNSSEMTHATRSRKNSTTNLEQQQQYCSTPSFQRACSIAEAGKVQYKQHRFHEAISKFVRARDYFCAMTSPSTATLNGHALFSSYLALAYLRLGLAETALEVLEDSAQKLAEHPNHSAEIPQLT
jgi:hypothetical protein